MAFDQVPTPDDVQELVIENLKKRDLSPTEVEIALLASKLDLDELLGEETANSLTLRQRAFLCAYAQHPAIGRACIASGVTHMTCWTWRQNSEAFIIAFEKVKRIALESAEVVAWRRAIDGTVDDVYGSGGKDEGTVVVGKRIVTHDGLLQFMMKHNHPERYKDRIEHSGTGPGGAIKMVIERRIIDPKNE